LRQRSTSRGKTKKLVLATFGSLGDVHPYLAIAIEWQRRGNTATIATCEKYRRLVEAEGVKFAAVRPDLLQDGNENDTASQVMDPHRGPEYLIRKILLPNIRASYNDLLEAAHGADLITSHPLTFAAPIVAKSLNIPWAYTAISPAVFVSPHDPPAVFDPVVMRLLNRLNPTLLQLAISAVKKNVSSWFDPLRTLSRAVGTHPFMCDPLGNDQFSPYLNIALFSSLFGARQPDWPSQTTLAGFPFYDPEVEERAPDGLSNFLSDGPPPIVFTLGSAAVMTAGDFYEVSAAVAVKLKRRAVLLVGNDPANLPTEPLPESIIALNYVPYSQLFPWSAAIVHQGGIGTTAQALRAGRPMLVVPFAYDQPDNGARIVRLGVGRVVSRKNYSRDVVAKELEEILVNSKYANSANAVGRVIRLENGAAVACDALEYQLTHRKVTSS
jgi:rhamnosyltransferase subunit B